MKNLFKRLGKYAVGSCANGPGVLGCDGDIIVDGGRLLRPRQSETHASFTLLVLVQALDGMAPALRLFTNVHLLQPPIINQKAI